MTNVAVLGMGAIGKSTAADLVGAGIDVVLIDQWPAHVEAMRRDGLLVLDTPSPVRSPHAGPAFRYRPPRRQGL